MALRLENEVWKDRCEDAKSKGLPMPRDSVDEWRGYKPVGDMNDANYGRGEHWRGQAFRNSKFGGNLGFRNRGGQRKHEFTAKAKAGALAPTLAPHLRGTAKGERMLADWREGQGKGK